jgi:hypothetical protein
VPRGFAVVVGAHAQAEAFGCFHVRQPRSPRR